MERMRVVSVNRGVPAPIANGDRKFMTGIGKCAAPGAVHIFEQGLDGDAIVDTEHHGGPDQAVYAYAASDYAWWSQSLGRDISFGTFGDNLTIDGLPSDLTTGDRLMIGDVILEATAPRIPCSTLAAAMQDSNFGLQFRRAERPGFYFRVLNEGDVAAGDTVVLVENPADCISMLEQFRLAYALHPGAAELQRALDAPIAERMRAKFQKRLAAARGETRSDCIPL